MKTKSQKGQTAIEYILLLMTVVAIVLVSFQNYLPTLQETGNIYYNRAAPGILGPPSRCGDGCCGILYNSASYGCVNDFNENPCRCPTDCGMPTDPSTEC